MLRSGRRFGMRFRICRSLGLNLGLRGLTSLACAVTGCPRSGRRQGWRRGILGRIEHIQPVGAGLLYALDTGRRYETRSTGQGEGNLAVKGAPHRRCGGMTSSQTDTARLTPALNELRLPAIKT